MIERACVYTALFGGYEELLEQPVADGSRIDFICFTDDPGLESDSWQTRLVQPVIPTDSGRSSRYPKICPHRFLTEYDRSLYIDNSVLLTRPPEEVIDKLLPDGVGFAAVEHSFRETVLDEFIEVKRLGYEAGWVCDEQLEHYRQSHPGVLAMKPLAGTVLVRRHMNPDVIKAMELWWFNVLRFSRRDQLSLLAALEQASLTPLTWPLDLSDSGYWRWPASEGRDRSRAGALPIHPDLETMKEQLLDRDDRIAEIEEKMQTQRRALASAQQAIADLSTRLRSRNDDIEKLNTSIAAFRRQLEAIQSSRSWRLMAGYRAMGDLVRRAQKRLRG